MRNARALSLAELFHAGGEEVLAVDSDFDAEGRAEVGALNYGAASEQVAGQSGVFQRIVKSAVAGIADKGMAGLRVAIVGFQFIKVIEVFEAAVGVGGAHSEGPIAGRLSGGTLRQANQQGRNVFTGGAIVEGELAGVPRLGEVGNGGDGGIRSNGDRDRDFWNGGGHCGLGGICRG